MKATFFVAAAGLVAAQEFGGQPQCALKCLQEYVPKAGCELQDTACQCAPGFQEKITPQISPCLMKECDPSDLPKALAAAKAACQGYAATAATGKTGSATTATETETETETEEPETDSDDLTGSLTASVDTSITGSVSLPAIFTTTATSVPVTPGVNGTATRATKTGTSGGETEETGTGSESGPETTESGASATQSGNAAAVAGPAFGGLLAVLAAVFAL